MAGLREALESVRSNQGTLTPAGVVDEWRPPEHAEHDRLTWDDAVAAEGYRVIEARRLIQSVRIEYTVGDVPRTIREFHAVRSPSRSAFEYQPIGEIAQDPVARATLLRTMEREWRAMQARYGDMAEFIEMIKRDLAA